ncbi:alanine--tRNA ligase [Candidatus Gracilibacteria bacterium]|nr:alanine--tRNA ligase [Candidatus Gracilibacteria bacterium]
MNAQEIRRAYLKFFKEKNHVVIPRASLVPQDDPTTLFTGSGMQPMVPYLLGENHPEGKRLVDSQTCFRSMDIEDVGDDRHTTFFEMLGNWSLGDYFKKEQIQWYFEFLVDVVGLDPDKIYVTCYIGDGASGVPRDDESAEIWQELFKTRGITSDITVIGSQADGNKRGIKPGERIFFYDDNENWWSRGGGLAKTPIGDPCGPDSEVFYDFGESAHKEGFGKAHPASDSGRFVEIGNNVFMQYRKVAEGKFELLDAPNIDHGSGLERVAQAAIDSPDMFKISLLWPIIEKLQKISGKSYADNRESMQVIADHLRAAMFLAVDGVQPSNKAQGYLMRRLMRRAILKAFNIGVEQNFVLEVAPVVAGLYRDDFPELLENEKEIINILLKEEKAFKQTLRKGLKEFKKLAVLNPTAITIETEGSIISQEAPGVHLDGSNVFLLYDTYGFPAELSVEEAAKQNLKVSENWQQEFDVKMQEQRERSQTATKGTFKGGLGGDTLQHKKYHTATHLMYQALREVLGDHVVQRGSNITPERLRFDFSHPEKVTPEQQEKVEAIVNEQIEKDLKVSWDEYPTQEATGPLGALGQFGDRYGETVKVYKMIADNEEKPFSFEICGGPHVDHTLQLFEDGKRFKIVKEQSSSAGIRRIKAVLQ